MDVRPWSPQKTIYRRAQHGNRVNAIAPGTVYTLLHRDTPKEREGQRITDGLASTVTDAVMYLPMSRRSRVTSSTSIAALILAAGNLTELCHEHKFNDRRGPLGI